MFARLVAAASAMLFVVGFGLFYASTTVHAAAMLPHLGNASGVPYYGGQIQDNNYTYYTSERDTAMNDWQSTTGHRYVDGWTSGETMTQYVVYSSSQQDTDLGNWFGTQSCKYWTDNGYSGYRSFEFGHHSLNRDSYYTVICLQVSSYGYATTYDSRDAVTRRRGMTHEMGHSLHLAHDTDAVMCTCWSFDI